MVEPNQQQPPPGKPGPQNPAPAPAVPQGNFLARISVSPALMVQYGMTADKLQVAIDAAVQELFQHNKTVTVNVSKV
jgi:hypothetical protein